MCTGVWGVLKDIQDPEFKGLVTSMKSIVLTNRAPATTTKYLCAFLRWKHWTEAHREVPVFPVKGTEFALYLQHLGDMTRSKSVMKEAVHSMDWVQQLVDLPLVHMVLDGLQHKLAKLKVRKEPVTRDMISALVNSIGEASSLADAACLLAFSAFLYYDEPSKLRCCDITFSPQRMAVRIASRKSNQYRQGESFIVAKIDSSACPVAVLEHYYAVAALPKLSKLSLFQGIVVTKSGERLRSHGSLSYTCNDR